ncbi:DUF58 domain-containing protein [Brevibacillus ruminantium]|uniref:DUF58 domain-containing protein n=1 Tax=Brevibacillus ruminantium TaxID=2950604 RepID=A0ABY4WNN8_9BACL|nr:DUF58 domain-containing protein [Brevibacillus ruminantium]USG67697.1 DUF58 domain-containing protein [Brevibacillus ruminantium]
MTTSSMKRSRPFQSLAKRFFDNGILPTRRMIIWLGGGAVVATAGSLVGIGYTFFWIYNLLLLLASVLDWMSMPRKGQFVAARILPEQTDIGQTLTVTLVLENHSGKPVRYHLRDDLPYTFDRPTEVTGVLSERRGVVSYITKGNERGLYTFSHLYLRYQGKLGLWEKQAKPYCPQAIKVYPDLSAVRGYLQSLQDSLIVDGKKILLRSRSGTEFHAIREYVPDDDPRHINWSASARGRRLMTNQFRPEQGKVLTLLLDCGRMMGVELDGRSKLDLSLEAALTLAAVALKQGDQVALLAFSHEIKTYIPPGRGLGHLHTLVEAVYDVRSDFVESNPLQALEYLHRQQKRRSLMVLFSDMENYLLEDQLGAYLWRLRRSHLLLLLSLADPLLHEWSKATVSNSQLAFVKALAQRFQLDRKAFQQNMIGAGIQVLDIPADQLTLTVVNSYLEIKRREAL